MIDPTHLDGDYYYDEASADHVVAFFRDHLCFVAGPKAGQPFILSDWQEELLRPLFGVRCNGTGERRYTTFYLELPKKNGKTELIAGIALYCLVGLNEPGAEIVTLATTRKQASICFKRSKGMVKASEQMSSKIVAYQGHLMCEGPGGFECTLTPLSAEAGVNDGINASVVIFDELHLVTWKLYNVMQGATGGRDNYIMIYITTAGTHDPNSVYTAKHDYACKVRDGMIDDPSWLVKIYAVAKDEEDDWKNEETWFPANPELDKAKSLKRMRELFLSAVETPSEQNTFKQFQLGIVTNQTTCWIDMDNWRDCAGDVNEAKLLGRPCYAGLDLSRTTDLSALTLWFPPEERGQPCQILPYFWLPRESLAKLESRDNVPYRRWLQEGWLESNPGNVIDEECILDKIDVLSEKYNIVELGFDPYNAHQLMIRIQKEIGVPCISVPQQYRYMSEASKEFEKLILKKGILHGGHPIMDWCVNNVAIMEDPKGNIMPDKIKSTQKIDGVVSTIIAGYRAIVCELPEGPSVYEERGVLVLL